MNVTKRTENLSKISNKEVNVTFKIFIFLLHFYVIPYYFEFCHIKAALSNLIKHYNSNFYFTDQTVFDFTVTICIFVVFKFFKSFS